MPFRYEPVAQDIVDRINQYIDSIYDDVVLDVQSALQSDDETIDITQGRSEVIEALVATINVEDDISQAVIEDMSEDTGRQQEDFAEVEKGNGIALKLYAAKVIYDYILRVQSAEAVSIFDEDERQVLRDDAVRISKNQIENTIFNQVSTNYALKHRQVAIDSGLVYFEYSTSQDAVVRPDHERRDGKVFIYGSERVDADVPGLEPNCRCRAIPLTFEESLSKEFFYSDQRPDVSANQKKVNKKVEFNSESGTMLRSMKNFYENKSYSIRAEIANDTDSVVLDVFGAIDAWDNNDYESLVAKIKAFLENDEQELVINLMSGGGNAFDGLSLYNYISSLKNRTVCHIHDISGSAATHISCACDHVTINRGGEFFVHEAMICSCFNKTDLKNNADEMISVLSNVDDFQLEIYQNKTGKSLDQLNGLIGASTTLSDVEALKIGFVDRIRDTDNDLLTMKLESNMTKESSKTDESVVASEKSVDEISKLKKKVTELESVIEASKSIQDQSEKIDVEEIKKQLRDEVLAEYKEVDDLKLKCEEIGIKASIERHDTLDSALDKVLASCGVSKTDQLDLNGKQSVYESVVSMMSKVKKENEEEIKAIKGVKKTDNSQNIFEDINKSRRLK